MLAIRNQVPGSSPRLGHTHHHHRCLHDGGGLLTCVGKGREKFKRSLGKDGVNSGADRQAVKDRGLFARGGELELFCCPPSPSNFQRTFRSGIADKKSSPPPFCFGSSAILFPLIYLRRASSHAMESNSSRPFFLWVLKSNSYHSKNKKLISHRCFITPAIQVFPVPRIAKLLRKQTQTFPQMFK